MLLPGLVPEEQIDRALEDLWILYPRPEESHQGNRGRLTEERLVNDDLWEPHRNNPIPDGRAMRPEQFLGMHPFPFPGSGHLNRLVVHPRLLDFAASALGSADLRLYQLGLWAKYSGLADYEQPMHTDTNHSLVPARMDPGWWHLEGFLYLSDVHDGVAPTRLVR